MISKVEKADARAQPAESWKLTNQLSGRKTSKKGIIKGHTSKERVDSWHKHFSELLGKEPNIPDMNDSEEIQTIFNETDLNIKTGPSTMDEYQEVKSTLQTGKQAGEDGFYHEVLKYCDLETMLRYENRLLIDNQKPQQWSDINLIPIPKSGDLGNTTNYRGIALSSAVAKLVNRMLLNRIQPKLDLLLRPNQNGFRPRCSTKAHILALRHPSVTGPLKALPPLFSNPQEILYAPSYLKFSQSPLIFKCPPCIILSCPNIVLFGEGQKFQNTPKKQQCPLINFDPPSSFFAP